jgi:hypothetical protein
MSLVRMYVVDQLSVGACQSGHQEKEQQVIGLL